jgi:hypothetical protein
VNFKGNLPGTALLAIAAGWVVAFPSAVEAEPSVTVMSVRASVSPTVVMKFEGSAMQLSVTEDDIARGYIDVPGTYRLTINTDRTMQQLANIMVDYEPDPYNFTSIQVAARTLQTGESNPYNFTSIQVAARMPQTAEPNPYNFISTQVAARALQSGEPNPNKFTSLQVAARALQTGEPRADTTLADFVNALPATAAGPFDGPRKSTEIGNSIGTFPRAQTVGDRASVTSLGYRLILPEKIKPGNISVPLTLSLQL